MVRLVGFHAILFSALTLLLSVPTPLAPARAGAASFCGIAPRHIRGVEATGDPVARRRPAFHSQDEGAFVHAISRTRTARPLGIDRA
jgi:hypothetical protein